VRVQGIGTLTTKTSGKGLDRGTPEIDAYVMDDASDMKAIESFHKKCQRMILGTSWPWFCPQLSSFFMHWSCKLHLSTCVLSDYERSECRIWTRSPDNFPHSRPFCAKSSCRLVDSQILRGNVHQVEPRAKWIDQLRHDNNNAPTATLRSQAIGGRHSRATL